MKFCFYTISIYRCDAEPSALAKYVCALVKKDKPEQDLKDICSDQLDVFLQLSELKAISHYNFFLVSTSYINWFNACISF